MCIHNSFVRTQPICTYTKYSAAYILVLLLYIEVFVYTYTTHYFSIYTCTTQLYIHITLCCFCCCVMMYLNMRKLLICTYTTHVFVRTYITYLYKQQKIEIFQNISIILCSLRTFRKLKKHISKKKIFHTHIGTYIYVHTYICIRTCTHKHVLSMSRDSCNIIHLFTKFHFFRFHYVAVCCSEMQCVAVRSAVH